MRAMTYSRYGGPEVLEQSEVPQPKVAPGTVLIRVKAASVNPVDWKVMSGGLDGMLDVHFPVIPGWDVAGVVERVGPDTPEFSPGDEVYAYGRRDTVAGGTYAEFVALPVSMVTRKPQSLSWEQAAGLPLTGMVAQRTLDALAPSPGETLLIHNGSGGAGRIGIQLGVERGLRVIATASEKHHQRLRELGAEPLEYGAGLVHRVRSLAPQGVDVAADFVGGVMEDTQAVLRNGGRHASIADPAVTEHGGSFIWVRPYGWELARLSELADAGKLSVDVDRAFPMDQAADAMRHSQQGHASGKIILTPFAGQAG
jgi:NADPH:quinone reductase-like Zn-dependent oxidoreductase